MGTRTRIGGSVIRAAGGVIFTAGLALACTDTTGTAPTYTVGGMVSGLTGSGLVLRNNGGDDLAVSANGPVAFATALSSGAAYSVTVFAQPSGPDQSCVVIGGSGQVSTANVTNIGVACTAVPTSELAFATVSAAVLAPSHTCGVTTSRVAYCWGNNDTGELGDGTTATSPTPVSVAGGLKS